MAALEIVSGVSVTKCEKMAAVYSVMCTIVIENWTKYRLEDAVAHINDGQISSPPTVVHPGKREMFITHYKEGTATGTYGTASWLISSTDQRAVVMWSCPWNFNHYTNHLAVGLTEKGTTKHEDWFDQMYTKKSGSNLHFVREEYYNDTKTISHKNDNFEITGTMGTTHVTEAHIIVRPLSKNGLAENLKKCVEKKAPMLLIDTKSILRWAFLCCKKSVNLKATCLPFSYTFYTLFDELLLEHVEMNYI
nr:mytiporin 7 [Mytilus galloprovincialis]